MIQKQDNNSFNQLAKPVRNSLAELGFVEPTLPQKMAIPHIIRGENVLLIAPTGSGKTEAVLLPIFSKLIQHGKRRGISVIYVTPLRALNRDLLKRLSFWSSKLDVSIEVRHGDTELKIRRKQALFPPDVLVTTPETLQAILPGTRMRQHLTNVKYVVIDEVHEIASSKRGVQLAVALERLRDLTQKEFQRIGLSATVGNPNEVAQFVAGTGRSIQVVDASFLKGYRYRVENPSPVSSDYDLAARLDTSPEAAARIRRILELVDSHHSTLIFVNARTIAEMLGYRFHQLGRNDINVHHGSISKEERAQIEDEFKTGSSKAIVCTSTLELGIDIGTVDLVIQYLSPRQINSLIQRVGRSGHRLDTLSDGTIITAFPDDTMESIAAVKSASENKLEPILIHENALDVLSHQIAGALMDKNVVKIEELLTLLRRAYPYRSLSSSSLVEMVDFLDRLRNIRVEEEGKVLRKSRKTRGYYYENLSMIPDEVRYPVINVISDRKIGTLGDEFMALKARVGLNIIVRGRVWRIVQIEQETGTVYVIPSEDPLAAIPGWDGEMLPVPFDLAQRTGKLREEIAQQIKKTPSVEETADKLSASLVTDKTALLEAVREIEEQLKTGAPLPTDKRILVEAFDKYLIVHASFGELVNRTLGCIFDAVLSDQEVIVGWWNDGYRILIETPAKTTLTEAARLSSKLMGLTDEEVDKAFQDYLEAKFPFSGRMKFVAERFGALSRGKTMSYERLAQLPKRFDHTPIYDETLREAMIEKVDLGKAKEIMHRIKKGDMKVSAILSLDKPTPLAYHILSKFSDMSELMAPERVLLNNIERMKRAIEARTVKIFCMHCGTWSAEEKVRNLSEQPACGKCGSKLLAVLYPSQDLSHLQDTWKKRHEGKEVTEEELKELTNARREADLTLSYGKKAIVAMEVKGVGPETASRVLGKMHVKEDEFYMDLLKAKIQYLRTRGYWEEKDSNDKTR
jgi:ATP-dependent helicase Lhr and Lhr-like helicase